MAMVHFFFTDAQFTSILKGELFGTTELLCKYGNRKILRMLIS